MLARVSSGSLLFCLCSSMKSLSLMRGMFSYWPCNCSMKRMFWPISNLSKVQSRKCLVSSKTLLLPPLQFRKFSSTKRSLPLMTMPSAGTVEPGMSCTMSPTLISSGWRSTNFLSLRSEFFLHSLSLRFNIPYWFSLTKPR